MFSRTEFSNSTQTSVPQTVLRGLLYFSDQRPALSIKEGEYVFINNIRTRCQIQDDLAVAEWPGQTSSRLRRSQLAGR